ncbi:MAG: type secretion system protein [Armatimonadetes bacterium]|jgi:general secretion pathway protein D|nr:type secretion system protein [Armatimonadota bacterium]
MSPKFPTRSTHRRSTALGSAGLALGLSGLLAAAAGAAPAPAEKAQPAARPAAVRPLVKKPRQPPETLSVNFPSIDIRQALATVASYAQADVLITPGASGKVSINLRNRAPEEVIRLVAASAGLSVLKTGSTYVVGPADEVRKAAAQLGESVVVPLENITPAQAVETLARLTPTVIVEPAAGAVVLSGLVTDLDTARIALRALDVKPAPVAVVPERQSTDVVSVRYTDPAEVERVFKSAFPAVRISRQDRTLIVTGTSAELDAVQRALVALDAAPPVTPEPPQPKVTSVYVLSFLNAKTAEESLKKAFPELIAVAGPEPTAPPPALFQPLSLTLGGGGSGAGGGGFGGGLGGGAGGGGFGGGGAGGQGGGAGGQGGNGMNYAQELSRSTRLILSGAKADVDAAIELLKAVDLAPPRVNIQAELVEIDSTRTRELGIDWNLDNASVGFTAAGGSGLRVGSITRGDFGLQATLQAMVLDNRARVLARPNISVVDNEDANIFIGELVRFRGTAITSPDAGTVQGTDTVPVGIALLVRPRIHSDGSVTLKVHPVISSVSETVNGLPQTLSREADTTVRLRDGETLVIGGLERDEETDQTRRIPGFSNLPLFGQFFRSRSKRKTRTEVVVIVRVKRIVDTIAGETN